MASRLLQSIVRYFEVRPRARRGCRTDGTGFRRSVERLEERCLLSAGQFDRGFDFGTSVSPVESGWLQVTEATRYSASLGYGWQAGNLASANRSTGTAWIGTSCTRATRLFRWMSRTAGTRWRPCWATGASMDTT